MISNLLKKSASVLLALPMLTTWFAAPLYAASMTQSDAARSGLDLPPTALYESAWQYLNSQPDTGVNKYAWQEWHHKFDGQLIDEARAILAISTAFAAVQGPMVELDCVAWPPAEAGIGLSFDINRKQEIEVMGVTRGGPAALSGLKRGDIITEIDGQAMPPWRLSTYAALRSTAQEGTKVRIRYKRAGQLYDVTLTRTKGIMAPETVCLMIDDVAYMRPAEYPMNDEALKFITTALRDLSNAGAQGLVLDLRDSNVFAFGNSDIAGFFLPKDSVLRIEKSITGSAPSKSSVEPLLPALPLVVLINKGTYLDSELIAAALKFHNRGKLIGEQSYGHMKQIPLTHQLDKMYLMRVWSTDWLPPDGKSIEGTGVQPDIVVPSTTTEEAPWYQNIKPGATPSPTVKNSKNEIADKQLRTALKILKPPAQK